MQTNPNINLTMLCDFYELTMANGYFRSGMQDKITYFDLYFRKVPDEGALPSRRVWSRRSSISRTCISAKTTSRIFARAAFSARISWTI